MKLPVPFRQTRTNSKLLDWNLETSYLKLAALLIHSRIRKPPVLYHCFAAHRSITSENEKWLRSRRPKEQKSGLVTNPLTAVLMTWVNSFTAIKSIGTSYFSCPATENSTSWTPKLPSWWTQITLLQSSLTGCWCLKTDLIQQQINCANLHQPDTDQLHHPAERVNFVSASDIESSPISPSTGCIN